MSIYVITSPIIKGYKIGYTKKRKDILITRKYLYTRYKTYYGCNLKIKYLYTFNTNEIGLNVEKNILNTLEKYRTGSTDEIVTCKFYKIYYILSKYDGRWKNFNWIKKKCILFYLNL